MLFNGNVVDPKRRCLRSTTGLPVCRRQLRVHALDRRTNSLLSLHLARLKDALVTFGMDIPRGLNLTNLEASLQAWSQQWPWSGDVRIRLTAREGAGAYAPSTDGVSWVATGAPLRSGGFGWPAKAWPWMSTKTR